MRKLLLVLLFLAFPALCYSQGVARAKVFITVPTLVTTADNGSGTAATQTLTVAETGLIQETCLDTQGCTMTMSETGARNGQVVTVQVTSSSTTCTWNNSSGVQETTGGTAQAIVAKGAISFQYMTDRWIEIFPATASPGAPTSATYITETADATLSAEFAMGSLATGIVKNTTTTGVPSIAVAGTDYVSPSSTESLTNKTIACYTVTTAMQRCGGKLALTDAQTKALPTTPITLVAAPGSGKTIVMLGAAVFSNTAAGAYTNVNAGGATLEAYYSGDSSVWILTPVVNDNTTSPAMTHLTDMLTVVGRITSVLIPYHDSPSTTSQGWVLPPIISSTTFENKAVVVAIDNNGSGNITGGNAANTLTWYFEYWIIG